MKINKRIAVSFLTIALTLTAVVGITIAQFTDQAVLAGNTLTTSDGSQLGIGTDGCGNTMDAISGIASNNVDPGESNSKSFCLKNDGETDLKITAMGNKTGGNLDPSLVEVKIDCGDGPVVVDLTGAESSPIVTLGTTSEDEVASCTITQKLLSEATNSASNKSITYDVVFNGTQVSE